MLRADLRILAYSIIVYPHIDQRRDEEVIEDLSCYLGYSYANNSTVASLFQERVPARVSIRLVFQPAIMWSLDRLSSLVAIVLGT
jgi:hypothetical protein